MDGRLVHMLRAQLLLAVVYWVAGKVGLQLALLHPSATPIWPPSGIAAASLILWGRQLWPGVLVGAWVVNATLEPGPIAALGIATGNTLEAVVAAGLAQRFAGGRQTLARPALVFRFALGAGLLAPLCSATLGVITLSLAQALRGRPPAQVWQTWWTGDASSILILAPVILAWACEPHLRRAPARHLEAAALLAATLLAGAAVFGGWPFPPHREPLGFLLLPVLVVAAFRLGTRDAATLVLLLAALALERTLHGSGPFAVAGEHRGLLIVQTFSATASVATLAIAAAIAQQRLAQRALQQSEQRLVAMFEQSVAGIVQTDDKGRIERVNHRFAEIVGRTPAALTGMLLVDLTHRDDVAASREVFVAVVAGAGGRASEKRYVRPDGTTVWVHGSVSPIAGPGEPVQHVMTVAQDIDAIKQAQQRLQQQSDELERANAWLQDLTFITSHDLKEPLRGIHQYAEILLEDEAERISAQGSARLRTIRQLSTRMAELLDALLEYGRVDRDRPVCREVDLETVLEEVLDLLRPRLEEHGVEVRRSRPLPRLVCDPHRIALVFRNLIANACKYSDKTARWVEIGSVVAAGASDGGEPIAAARANRAAEAAMALPAQRPLPVLYVRDNGIGIPPRHHETIFRMFKRLHARDAFGGGSGAGLAIVRRIVESHGGRIQVTSMPGEGSTFWFTLGPGEPFDGAAFPSVADAQRGSTAPRLG